MSEQKRGGLWRKGGLNNGKYLVLRRDGTVPECANFVFLERDPSAPAGLRAYADEAEGRGYHPQYVADMRELSDEWEASSLGEGDPDAGPHRIDMPLVVRLMDGEFASVSEALEAQDTRIAELEQDKARLEWYFSSSPPKDQNFMNVYLQGMREGWTPDQWRAAIDDAMEDPTA